VDGGDDVMSSASAFRHSLNLPFSTTTHPDPTLQPSRVVFPEHLHASSAVAAIAASVEEEEGEEPVSDVAFPSGSRLFAGIHIAYNKARAECRDSDPPRDCSPRPAKKAKREDAKKREELGGDGQGAGQEESEPQAEQDSLESRFNALANQLSMEIKYGNSSHASTVATPTATSSSSSFAQHPVFPPSSSPSSNHMARKASHQQLVFSSKSMSEVKPSRRVLNNLIKPSDDCVYTSFRIRPRNCGRRGGRRGSKRRGGAASTGVSRQDVMVSEMRTVGHLGHLFRIFRAFRTSI
jgi:hypothetical protein